MLNNNTSSIMQQHQPSQQQPSAIAGVRHHHSVHKKAITSKFTIRGGAAACSPSGKRAVCGGVGCGVIGASNVLSSKSWCAALSREAAMKQQQSAQFQAALAAHYNLHKHLSLGNNNDYSSSPIFPSLSSAVPAPLSVPNPLLASSSAAAPVPAQQQRTAPVPNPLAATLRESLSIVDADISYDVPTPALYGSLWMKPPIPSIKSDAVPNPLAGSVPNPLARVGSNNNSTHLRHSLGLSIPPRPQAFYHDFQPSVPPNFASCTQPFPAAPAEDPSVVEYTRQLKLHAQQQQQSKNEEQQQEKQRVVFPPEKEYYVIVSNQSSSCNTCNNTVSSPFSNAAVVAAQAAAAPIDHAVLSNRLLKSAVPAADAVDMVHDNEDCLKDDADDVDSDDDENVDYDISDSDMSGDDEDDDVDDDEDQYDTKNCINLDDYEAIPIAGVEGDDEDDDNDEDDWTESSGSSSLSSACFLHSASSKEAAKAAANMLVSPSTPPSSFPPCSVSTADALPSNPLLQQQPSSSTSAATSNKTTSPLSLSNTKYNRRVIRVPPSSSPPVGSLGLLRGAQETWDTIFHRYCGYQQVSCQSCRSELSFVHDVDFVLCPVCRDVTGVNTLSSTPVINNSTNAPAVVSVGLGFTLNDLRMWELRESKRSS